MQRVWQQLLWSELVLTVHLDANHLHYDANFGWIYIVFAIAFVATLLAPIEQSTVFFRMMLVGSFINSIRLIIIYMGADGGANPVPMIASILVFVLMNILYNNLESGIFENELALLCKKTE